VPLTAPTTHIVSAQGAELGRPSTVHVAVDHDEVGISAVRVGGAVVLVMEGVARV
jgi:predicted PhzF superfamily epimerase YddE/YHI9